MPVPAPDRPSADPNAFDEAVEWFRDRLLMTDEEYEKAEQPAQKRAFHVAGAAHLRLVADVWEALDDALAKGTTLRDFQEAVSEKLATAWGGDQPWRVETIYRTNLQTAYSRGRWEQQTDPAVRSLRPYWEYSAILDTRTTPHCRDWNGKILRSDDPVWNGHNPPCHHNCRSTIISLTERQAAERGVTPEPPTTPAADGFGGAPDDDWRPDLSGYPPELQGPAHEKIAAGG